MPLKALVGLPGSGKSTVGRQIAKILGLSFIDSDLEVERRTGGSIRLLFEREGEAGFRDLEANVIAELLRADVDCVLATGGGAVLRECNRRALHNGATVVYLHSDPEILYRRLRHDRRRPLLQVADVLQKLRDLYVERDPLYRETAHLVTETGPSMQKLVTTVLESLALFPASAAHARRD